MTTALTEIWFRQRPVVLSPDLDPASPLPISPIEFHRRLPEYQPTPIHDLHDLAGELKVEQVLVKDETSRLGLPAFKMLGASWAIYRALLARWPDIDHHWETIDDLRVQVQVREPISFAAATDGNHGRAVARMAAMLGCEATIVVPSSMVPARIEAIEGEGATVEIVEGTYDAAVARSAELASDRCIVISDTAWPGYDLVPRWVIEGYSTMFRELQEQCRLTPSHTLVPMGVGALAAAAIVAARHRMPPATVIGVEPDGAPCVLKSLQHGAPVTIPGPHESVMSGLNCDQPSPVAWPVLAAGLSASISIPDDAAKEAMRILARNEVVAGETGAASLGGLLAIVNASDATNLRSRLHLDKRASVLILATEGATDPEAWEKITRRSLQKALARG
ncbi:MAG: diaminopropionate ammonia-lyase [Chloroflexota bacterium]|nr:diaminopropionate ammonia-lyase [Chloroflexota bacterium]